MKLSDYSVAYQGSNAIDAASLENYEAMVKSLNGLIMKAATEKLRVDNEPSDFERLILRQKS